MSSRELTLLEANQTIKITSIEALRHNILQQRGIHVLEGSKIEKMIQTKFGDLRILDERFKEFNQLCDFLDSKPMPTEDIESLEMREIVFLFFEQLHIGFNDVAYEINSRLRCFIHRNGERVTITFGQVDSTEIRTMMRKHVSVEVSVGFPWDPTSSPSQTKTDSPSQIRDTAKESKRLIEAWDAVDLTEKALREQTKRPKFHRASSHLLYWYETNICFKMLDADLPALFKHAERPLMWSEDSFTYSVSEEVDLRQYFARKDFFKLLIEMSLTELMLQNNEMEMIDDVMAYLAAMA